MRAGCKRMSDSNRPRYIPVVLCVPHCCHILHWLHWYGMPRGCLVLESYCGGGWLLQETLLCKMYFTSSSSTLSSPFADMPDLLLPFASMHPTGTMVLFAKLQQEGGKPVVWTDQDGGISQSAHPHQLTHYLPGVSLGVWACGADACVGCWVGTERDCEGWWCGE